MKWKQNGSRMLPDDILELILSKMPLESLSRFRLVSRQWNSDLIPKAALLGRVSREPVLLYLDEARPEHRGEAPAKRLLKFAVSKSQEQVSRQLDPLYFPQELRYLEIEASGGGLQVSRQLDPLYFPQDLRYLEIVASEGGLLCFIKRCSPSKVCGFLVCNPLTGKYRDLHSPDPYHPRMLMGLVTNAATGSYKLVLSRFDDEVTMEHTTLVYDSLSCSWRKTTVDRTWLGSYETDQWLMERWLPGGSICFNGYLYFYLAFRKTVSEAMLVRYDARRDVWSKVKERPEFPHKYGGRTLAKNTQLFSANVMPLLRARLEVTFLRGHRVIFRRSEMIRKGETDDGYLIGYYSGKEKDVFYSIIHVWPSVEGSEDPVVKVVAYEVDKGRRRRIANFGRIANFEGEF